MKAPFHSIRWQIQVWHGAILLGVVVACCFAAYQVIWNDRQRKIDQGLVDAEVRLMKGLLGSSAVAEKTTPEEERAPSRSSADMMRNLRDGEMQLSEEARMFFSSTKPGFYYYTVRDNTGKTLLRSPNAPAELAPPPVSRADLFVESRTRGTRRELFRTSYLGLSSLVGRDISPELEELKRLAWSLAASGMGVLTLGLFGGWWLAGRVIQPIDDISRAAARISDGNLGERISEKSGYGELHELTRVLNGTFARLDAAFERQKQFTADASHELRTPITILLSEAQRALKRVRTEDEYRAVIATCLHTAERMRNLVESLLLLARQESIQTLITGRCDLVEITKQVAEEWQPAAAKKKLSLRLELHPAFCTGDAASLSIVVSNLIGNAIEHNPAGTNIGVVTRTKDGCAMLSVADNGIGISPDDLGHLFERFFRADRARTPGSGHSGLGLAIVKAIVENHGGNVSAESTNRQGTTVRVSLPSAQGG